MSELLQKWSALKTSEQQMLLYGGVLILFSLLYFYAWKPYTQTIKKYDEKIQYTQEDIRWLKDTAKEIQQLRTGVSASKGAFQGSFINTVDKSLKQQQLNAFVSLLENSGGDNVVIQLKKVDFNRVIKWIDYIKKRYGILVKNSELQREGLSGEINARIILKKS